jgi:hypothetical protein
VTSSASRCNNLACFSETLLYELRPVLTLNIEPRREFVKGGEHMPPNEYESGELT